MVLQRLSAPFLVLALAAAAHAENLTGWVNRITSDIIPTGRLDMVAYDYASTATPHSVKVCWDDPAFLTNCDTITSPGATDLSYPIPLSVGSINPRDGQQHTVYVKIVSIASPGSGDVVLSGSGWPYRFVNGALAQMWPARLESAPARGVTPATLAVFANSQDPYSVGASGNTVCTVGGTPLKDDGAAGYYVEKYGIPCGNVRVVSTAVTPNLNQANFTAQILPSVTSLPASIQAIAVAWVQPVLVGSMVAGQYSNSLTSMIATGGAFQNTRVTYQGCGGDFLMVNPYFNSTSTAPYTDFHLRPTMMLVGELCTGAPCATNSYQGPYVADFNNFKKMVDAAYAARNTNPSGGHVDWVISSDTNRSIAGRVASSLTLGQALSPLVKAQVLGTLTTPYTLDINDTNILVYDAAAPHAFWGKSTVVPGAAAVWPTTSSAGSLPFDGNQTPLGYFLANGAVGTYGTVAEPCVAFVRKFPDPAVFVPLYTQGQTMVEALWKSVYFPWSGAFAGDPLASPFSVAPPVAGPVPMISPGGVVNAASYLQGPVSPGTVITIFGSNLGPSTLAGLQLDASGLVSTSTGGTRVLINGIPSPVVSAIAGQVSAIVPFEVPSNTNAQVVVEYLGVQSDPAPIGVADTSPAIFTMDASGQGQGAILNQDSSMNSSANPAVTGSTVVLYATGGGVTVPASVDGSLAAGVLSTPVQAVSVNIAGQAASVPYAGAAPGLVAGVMQVNAVVPLSAPSGNQPVVIQVGSASSQPNVTLSVK